MPSVAQEVADVDGRAGVGNTAVAAAAASAVHGLSILAKKRRWEDNRGGYASSHGGVSSDVVAILVHGSSGDDRVDYGNRLASSSNTANTSTNPAFTFSQTLPPQPRRIMPPAASKRVRLSSSGSSSCHGGSEHDDCRASPSSKADRGRSISIPSPSPSSSSSSSFSIRPCHICQRRPRRKCDLDSLADCEGCGQRTCFVCLRECLGWPASHTAAAAAATVTTAHIGRGVSRSRSSDTSDDIDNLHDTDKNTSEADEDRHSDGHDPRPYEHPHGTQDTHKQPWSAASRGHRRMVCSRCCVERGEDGDVACLGCLASAGEYA